MTGSEERFRTPPEICDACGFDAYDGDAPLRCFTGLRGGAAWWLCPQCVAMLVPEAIR